MGYYASGDGGIQFKSASAMKKAKDIIADTFEYDNSGQPNDIDIWYPNDKYHDDEIINVLMKIEPYVKSGFINFTGEDSTHWQFLFNTSSKTWDEENGQIIYGNPDVYQIMQVIHQDDFKNADNESAIPCMITKKICFDKNTAMREKKDLIASLKKQKVKNASACVKIIKTKLYMT